MKKITNFSVFTLTTGIPAAAGAILPTAAVADDMPSTNLKVYLSYIVSPYSLMKDALEDI